MNKTYETMKSMTFGVELEYENISRENAARAVAGVFGTTTRYVGNHLDNWEIPTGDGRVWTVESDGSLSCGCETVSPVCTIDDMEKVQAVVRALRAAGAKARTTCGLHVHVGAKDMTPNQLATLAKMWYMNENFMVKGAGTQANRLYHYTRATAKDFTDALAKAGTNVTWEKFADAYYHHDCGDRTLARNRHYCEARYRTLNFHNICGTHFGWHGAKPTVEYRLFEATTHAGEVRANILAAMAFTAKAKTATRVVYGKGDKYEVKGTRANWETEFKYLGWTGDEMKIVRLHFIKRAMGL